MENSGVSAYLRLRELDPALCQGIVKFAEQAAARHNLQPAVAVDIKQALCQFAVNIATRGATRRILYDRDAPRTTYGIFLKEP